MKWLRGIAIVVLSLVVVFYWLYPNYSYRYRLTVDIEADGKVHSGSSVIEVTWRKFPEFGGIGPFHPSIKGQATVVDLGNHGVIVATLLTGGHYGPAPDGALGALWLTAEAFGNHSTGGEIPALTRLRGKRAIDLTKMPRLLWFSNPADPKSAQKIDASDIPAILGPSVHFVRASVEITSDPIRITIRDQLPWLVPLEPKRRDADPIRLSNGITLDRYMFIGDGS